MSRHSARDRLQVRRRIWRPKTGGLDHRQTGDRHQMAQTRLSVILAMEVEGSVGRPKIDQEIRGLIGKMSRGNPLWGVPRIQAELRLLGYDLSENGLFVAKMEFSVRTGGRHAGLPPHRFAHRTKAGLSSLHGETTLTASTASTPKLASNLPRNRTKRYGVGAAE